MSSILEKLSTNYFHFYKYFQFVPKSSAGVEFTVCRWPHDFVSGFPKTFSEAVMLRAQFMPATNKFRQPPRPPNSAIAMPAEWEPHAATWLGWPHNASDWPGKFEVIPWVYGEMVRKISAGENICLIVRHKKDEQFARHVFKTRRRGFAEN